MVPAYYTFPLTPLMASTGWGVHLPKANDAFPPISDFPPILEHLLESINFFPTLTFFQKYFLVVDSQFVISPLFLQNA